MVSRRFQIELTEDARWHIEAACHDDAIRAWMNQGIRSGALCVGLVYYPKVCEVPPIGEWKRGVSYREQDKVYRVKAAICVEAVEGKYAWPQDSVNEGSDQPLLLCEAGGP